MFCRMGLLFYVTTELIFCFYQAYNLCNGNVLNSCEDKKKQLYYISKIDLYCMELIQKTIEKMGESVYMCVCDTQSEMNEESVGLLRSRFF